MVLRIVGSALTPEPAAGACEATGLPGHAGINTAATSTTGARTRLA